MGDFIIGRRLFTDGSIRNIRQGDDGRQYVIGHAAERVYGVWILTEEAEADARAIILAGKQNRARG